MDQTTRALASFATGLTYEALPPTVVHEATRRVIDSFGCALGGYDGEPSSIARRLAAARTGTPAATVLGDGCRSTPEMAALANGVMVRYLDCNDTHISTNLSHPSDLIPGVLAMAEAYQASGRDLIAAIVAGYEAFAVLADLTPLGDRGWDQGVMVALGSVVGASKILGLSAEQMGNAIAIAVTANNATRQTRAGELAMWKGCATAVATSAGVMAALLAREGMTGPTAAFEGRHGIWDQVTGPFDVEAMGGQNGRPFAVARSSLKFFPSQYDTQALIWLALQIRPRVEVDEIERVEVQTYGVAYHSVGSEPQKWDPQTRETADHSLPYLLAVALRDGAVTPASFELARIQDPELRPLLARIAVTENPAFTAQFPAAMISELTVTTREGQRLVEHAEYPKGHARNPMTDAELEEKFRAFAEPRLGSARCRQVLDALWHLDDTGDLSPILAQLTIPGPGPAA